MRKQFLTPFCIVTAVLAVLLIWLATHKAHGPNQISEAQALITNAPVVENTMRQSVAVEQSNSTANIVTPVASEQEPTTEAEKNAKVRKMLEAQNKPIELWGKVVDQDDVPLSDVTVETEINHFVWPPEQYPNGVSTKQEMTTDAGGQFHVSDSSATGIHVMLQKAGYEQESRNGYGSNGQNGSQENPAILKMWSTNIHEQLITGGNKFHIVPDGRSYVIDLTKGTIAESGDGDLKVWVKRPEQITYGKRYDWSCEMDAINGGILQESDDSSSMYSAPTDGYAPSFQFEQKIGSGWGDTTGEKRFYVRLNNGQEYGRITIELMAYYNDQIPGMIRLSYAINPSGSRILR
jgi:hypothetical protein